MAGSDGDFVTMLTASGLNRLRYGISTAAFLTVLAAPAAAQQSGSTPVPDAAVDASAPPTEPDPRKDIVVTGTLFRNSNVTLISPTTVLTSETLQRANITTVQDAIRSVSADGAGSISTGFKNGFSAGGAAVSLRGLGVSSTVVLIDGLRSANFPLSDDGHNSYVDLNSIPFSVIDHVEVLKDGASSIYGADAIGGVVNLISRKNVQGVDGSVQAGTTEHGDGSHYRATLTAGVGDYQAQGFNFYLNGEYTYDGFITNHSRGYPFNTLDLSRSGLLDRNRNDDSLTIANPEAVVTRVEQTDLNNPLAGKPGKPLTNRYQLLDPTACARGTYTLTAGAAQGTGCRHDLADEYAIIQPRQQRYSTTARLTARLSDQLEAFASASYSHSDLSIVGGPAGIQQPQPFGGRAALASSNPGIVLPMYVCASGVNCATAADRRLNPNNPYAVPGADPSLSAARIFYSFGDIPAGTDRYLDVFRTTAGISGKLGNGFSYRLNGVYARDNFSVTQHGAIQIQGLLDAINTGAYDFVHPAENSAAVRAQISPDRTTPSYSTVATIGGSLLKSVMALAGGDLNMGAGFQLRRETLMNRNQNADLSYYGLNTSSARGRQSVNAGFFEIDAPFLPEVDLNLSGRYDHYSQGYGHFSPKLGLKVTPLEAVALRGTYSQGFRAPTFAESNPASRYAGYSSFAPPASFVAAHAGNPAYSTTYSIGNAAIGNPALRPEVSRSISLGTILRPARWFDLTADYYNVRKSDLIVSGPQRSAAINAYYHETNATAGCAALAKAGGAGYSCEVYDAPDPANPDALPRLLVFNVPYVNASYEVSSGIDVQANARIPLGAGLRLIDRLDVTRVLRLDLVTPEGVVQRYAGTLGPYGLSSGGGTPRVRGNWQNTLEAGAWSLTTTTYYVGRIKQVAADRIEPVGGQIDLSCQHTLAPLPKGADVSRQCYVRPFVYADLNAAVAVNDRFRFFLNVQNVANARAPLASGAYTSNPNYLVSWHYAGLVGRNFSAGAKVQF